MLPILDALKEYDKKYHVTNRKYIRLTFREIIHILATAQVCFISLF